MRLVIATDAWSPQINGVVRSLHAVGDHARRQGHDVTFITPRAFTNIPCPGERDIRLALATSRDLQHRLNAIGPDHVHIATEGPIGWAARSACLATGQPFTTSYHTRFPEYLRARYRVPPGITYAALRRFHNASSGTMVATRSIERELAARGFRHLMRWTRGVDHILFHPQSSVLDLPRPIFLSVGRLAVEKNIEAFLRLDLPGTKVVIGEGPAREDLQASFPTAVFLGAKEGEDLAAHYASADVLVFPSRTDTFGLVMLEALASGVPVAALPVPGPLDVIGDSGAGVLDKDLRAAALQALSIPRERARAHAETFTWARSAEQFLDAIRVARERLHATASSAIAHA